MNEALLLVLTHPLADLAILLSIGGAAACIVFVWGLTGFVLAHEDYEHQHHAVMNMLIGLSWMISLFVVWEVIRWVVSLY